MSNGLVLAIGRSGPDGTSRNGTYTGTMTEVFDTGFPA